MSIVGLTADLFVAGNWVEAGAIKTNVTGTPIVTATPLYDGFAIAGVYTLTFTSVVATTSATLHIAADFPSNPYDGASGAVVLDASTASLLLGGVSLVFSNSGSFTGSWTATVTIGIAHGALNAFPPTAGTPTAGVRVRVRNTGSAKGTGCVARVLQSLKPYKKTGTVFAAMRTFAPSATENLSAGQEVPYVVAASSVSGSGASKTMTVKVDGSNFNVTDLTTGVSTTSTGLGVVHYYRATSGPLTDMEFLLSQAAVNSDVVNVLTFPNVFTQLAIDLGSSAGEWGTADIALTGTDQSDGVIDGGGADYAYLWTRVLAPANSNALSNPYICDVALEGSALAAAGWSN